MTMKWYRLPVIERATESVPAACADDELVSELEDLLDCEDAGIRVTWPTGYDALRARRFIAAAKSSAASVNSNYTSAAAAAAAATAAVSTGTSNLPSLSVGSVFRATDREDIL